MRREAVRERERERAKGEGKEALTGSEVTHNVTATLPFWSVKVRV